MADSLVLANAIELLAGGVASDIPACEGAIFYLAPGWDLGAPQPVTDIVASLILDGERPFGRRASNRTVTLPIVIQVPIENTADGTWASARTTLAAAREVLLEAIDAQTWTLTWTRDGSTLPLVLDCFRALPSVLVYSIPHEQSLVCQIEIQFQALPYGRSDQQVQVQFQSPVPGTPAPPPQPVVLDTFSSVSGAQWGQSNECVIGPWTAFWDPGNGPAFRPDGDNVPLVYEATLANSTSISGLTALSVWVGLGSRYYWNLEWRGRTKCYFAFELTDTNGNSIVMYSSKKVPVSQNPYGPAWTFVTVPIPQNDAVFDYDSVTSYTITITNRSKALRWVVSYLDNLVANPSSLPTLPAATRGVIYTLYGINGTSHASVSLQFQQPPTPQTATTLTTTGAGNYTVPANTSYLAVYAVGGGGAGASLAGAGIGGGGGGAESATEQDFPAASSQVIPYNVGTGGTSGNTPVDGLATFFGPGPSGALVVQANGGKSAPYNAPTGGLGGTGSLNQLNFDGGAGRTASGTVGGGGGSSGGTAAPGATPQGVGSTTLSGSGNFTVPNGVFQLTLQIWGAGGAGGNGSNSTNGAGGAGGAFGQITIPVSPGQVGAYVCGAGGSPSGSSGGTGGNGAASTFIINGNTYAVAGGTGGSGNNNETPGTGGAAPSGFSSAFKGGNGGSAYPYGGGGGSSAGTNANGNTGKDPSGAAAPTNGGAGGNGSGTGNVPGSNGAVPGGGGGGTYWANQPGGSGGNGQIIIQYPSGTGAPTANGAGAVAGGGAGGAGGGGGNAAGSAGSVPGGGGGGATSSGSAEAGGAGGSGKIIVTPYAPATFKTLIVHRPGPDAPASLNPYVGVGNGTGTPNGATEYPLASLVSGVNARFGGTYSIMLINFTWNNPTASRTLTVMVKQYEYTGGPSYSSSVSVTVTPSTQINNGIVTVGNLTLPYKDIAPDNQGAVFTVTVTSSNTADRFLDVLFLDTMGQTVVVNEPSTGYINYFIDEPDSDRDLGRVLGSSSGRPNAVSVTDFAEMSGGPLTVEPGNNLLFCYCVEGAPNLAVSYFPRWFLDRLY